jgi:hypothetical protein
MKKQPTEEQKQKAAARRANIRAMCKQIAAMSDEQRTTLAARMPGVVTVEGRPLSFHNQLMIAFQLPAATILGGFRQWIKNGRAVRKGEHGAAIWCPIGAPKPTADGAEVNADGERPGFILGTVFDVSQTDPINDAAASGAECLEQLAA